MVLAPDRHDEVVCVVVVRLRTPTTRYPFETIRRGRVLRPEISTTRLVAEVHRRGGSLWAGAREHALRTVAVACALGLLGEIKARVKARWGASSPAR